MDLLSTLLHIPLPVIAAILLVVGMNKKEINFIITALWLSLIALIIHYQTAGGEILGSYFNYLNASIYSLNIIILIATVFCLFLQHQHLQGTRIRYFTGFISAFFVAGSVLLLINLWINAYFIENRSPNTPIIQVATFTPLSYCSYRYLFYKIGKDGTINYMCPNYYGMIPSLGTIDISPDFLLNHLAQQVKTKISGLHNK